MPDTLLLGILVVVLSGLIMGTSPWPLKLLRHFQYEHFAFISMLVGLVILPWAITLLFCPQPFTALAQVKGYVLLKANLFAFSWGIAQVLALLCFVRIGVSLTYGILCSIGAAVGVITPMIFKASGVFQGAPDLLSKPGLIILFGVVVMVLGVVFASMAGAGREKLQTQNDDHSQRPKFHGKFAVGLTMADYGIAETGTLVIGSRDENLRLATMLCDIHVAVLPVSGIREQAEDIADQMTAWMQTGGDYTAFITGASRTADIERVLAIGVHGPLELHILLLEDA